MAVVIHCKACRRRVKSPPCPSCGSAEMQFYVDYFPDGRRGGRKKIALDESIQDISSAKAWDEEYRAVALENRKPGTSKHNLTLATVEDLTPDYLEWVRLHYTKQTYREREYTMKYINAIIGNVPVQVISEKHFSLYQKTRSAQFQKTDKHLKISGRTVNKELNYVRGFLKWAKKEKGLATNKIDYEKLPEPRPLPIVLSPSEVSRLLEAADPFYRAFILCLYTMGLRFTEAQQLKWDDVDFENMCCRAQQKGRTFKILPISARLVAALKEIGPPAEGKFIFVRKYKESKYKREAPIVNVRKGIAAIMKKAGITKKVYPHLFRHSAACNMLTDGVNLRTIQQMLGHADIESTTWYTHIAMSHLRGAGDSIEEGLSLRDKAQP